MHTQNSIKKTYQVQQLDSDTVPELFDTETEAIEYTLHDNRVGLYFTITSCYQNVHRGTNLFRATIIMPVWQCPARTLRAIKSVIAQDTNGWQLICIGDGCNQFADLLKSNWLKEAQAKAYIDGNEIIALNTEHFGGYGYHQRELAKQMATGKWTMYLDNDDDILPTHVSTRLNEAEFGPDPIDLIYFDTWLQPTNWHRDAQLEYGRIGHSEVMYRTSLLKQLSPMPDTYGHDWSQIDEAIKKGAKHRKGGGDRTYIVRSLPSQKETGID